MTSDCWKGKLIILRRREKRMSRGRRKGGRKGRGRGGEGIEEVLRSENVALVIDNRKLPDDGGGRGYW